MASGKEWASSSARTLARRLRRREQQRVGLTRSRALASRTAMLREALRTHWDLEDLLGAHFPAAGQAASAARLLGVQVPSHSDDIIALGNWARHSRAPDAFGPPPPPPSTAVLAHQLEEFRADLFSAGCRWGQQGVASGNPGPLRLEARLSASFGSAALRFQRAVAMAVASSSGPSFGRAEVRFSAAVAACEKAESENDEVVDGFVAPRRVGVGDFRDSEHRLVANLGSAALAEMDEENEVKAGVGTVEAVHRDWFDVFWEDPQAPGRLRVRVPWRQGAGGSESQAVGRHLCGPWHTVSARAHAPPGTAEAEVCPQQ